MSLLSRINKKRDLILTQSEKNIKVDLVGPVQIANNKMYLHATDQGISPLILDNKFEKLETALINLLVKAGMIACDVGAHIGYYSLILSRLVGKRGKVYAFEPDPINFQILKKNKFLNKLNNLKIVRIAISDKIGKTRLFLSKTNTGDHRIYNNNTKRDFITVKATTLDNYLNSFDKRVDLIKMDIQGAEMVALKGMINCIEKNPDIMLITEFWPEGLRGFGVNPIDFLNLLDKLNFNIYNINEQKSKIELVSKTELINLYRNKNSFTNLLCTKKNLHLSNVLPRERKSKEITTFKQLKESYERIWIKGDLREEQTYYKWIISLLGDVKSKKLLDIGCGGGYLLEESVKNGIRATGLEISEAAIKKARDRAPKAKIIQGIAEKLPFKDKDFNIVVCLGSLEHFLSPQKALKEMVRVLKDEGTCCIVLPNRWAIDGILEGIVRGNDMSHGQELERFYSLKEAMNLLTKDRFVIRGLLSYNKPRPTDIRTGTKLSCIANLVYKNVYKFIRWHIPIRLSYVFVFILKKDDILDKTIH